MAVLINPLIEYLDSKQEFVPYDKIHPEHIVPAVQESIVRAGAKLENILKLLDVDESQLTFKSVMLAFIEMEEIVENIWTPVENLLSLMGDKATRDAAEEARPLVVEFFNNYSLDPRVYDLVKRYSKTKDAKSLSGEYARYLETTLRDFKLSGAEIEGAAKEEFKKLNLELSQLSQKFSNNVTDSKFELVITDEAELSGLPEDVKQRAWTEACGAWVFSLDYPSYVPFMQFADRGDLRKKMYFEYLHKASKEHGHGEYDNAPLIRKIYAAKIRKSKLLGYRNYAEVSLTVKMAKNPRKVQDFLERIGSKVLGLAKEDYGKLVDFQKEINYQNTENNPGKIYPWDKEYLSEKLRQAKYDLDTNLIKQYFELQNTIQGMFHIAETLFQIKFRKLDNVTAWHEEVEVFEVVEAADDHRLGVFYMDLYPRDTKRQGAWVMPLVQGAELIEQGKVIYRKPQCALVCNLTKAQKDIPSLLSHDEVWTLFHEFGHALHHLLSKVRLAPMSGTDVEWDFVELPSQLNENFAWEAESLKTFAKHYKTGEAIPQELLNKMLQARNFNEGLACIRQLEFGLFDLEIYLRDTDTLDEDPVAIFRQVCNKFAIFDVIDGTYFPNQFSHIFAGGYAAGYYSYKWAEVLEADAFSRFKKEGILNPKVGAEYRTAILEKGDSEDPMELFKDFMGREPDENALLERMGINRLLSFERSRSTKGESGAKRKTK
jgi:peptidyl-dipeptidase Dcp